MFGMRILQRPGSTAPALAVRVSGAVGHPSLRPVVLVHGMGGDHTTWRSAAVALRLARRQVVAVDLRGHGRSGRADRYLLDDFRDDLRHVVDALDLDRFDMVAHSLGAHTALRVAMAEPDRIGRLVLEEPPPMPRDDADLAEGIAPTASLGQRVRGLAAVVADPRPLLRFDRAVPGAVGAQFERTDADWWESLAAVTAPALVISGGSRSFLPPRHLRRVAEALPSGDFAVIEAGHSVHRDRGREFADAMTRHLLG